jgi:hypothetical protein
MSAFSKPTGVILVSITGKITHPWQFSSAELWYPDHTHGMLAMRLKEAGKEVLLSVAQRNTMQI